MQGVDSTVATVVRAIVMAVFLVVFVMVMGKGPQLPQLTSRDMVFIVLPGLLAPWVLYFATLILDEKITLKTAIAGTLIFIGVLLLAI